MSVLVGHNTRLVVQGMSGSAGAFHARQMVEYGTNVVAGVTPGKGGAKVEGLEKVPMFDTVAEAVEHRGANTSVIYVPPPFAADSILEAAAAGIDLIIAITEGIPARDMVKVKYVLDREYPESVQGVAGRGPQSGDAVVEVELHSSAPVHPVLRHRRRREHRPGRAGPPVGVSLLSRCAGPALELRRPDGERPGHVRRVVEHRGHAGQPKPLAVGFAELPEVGAPVEHTGNGVSRIEGDGYPVRPQHDDGVIAVCHGGFFQSAIT